MFLIRQAVVIKAHSVRPAARCQRSANSSSALVFGGRVDAGRTPSVPVFGTPSRNDSLLRKPPPPKVALEMPPLPVVRKNVFAVP